jgi:hypothetical protein
MFRAWTRRAVVILAVAVVVLGAGERARGGAEDGPVLVELRVYGDQACQSFATLEATIDQEVYSESLNFVGDAVIDLLVPAPFVATALGDVSSTDCQEPGRLRATLVVAGSVEARAWTSLARPRLILAMNEVPPFMPAERVTDTSPSGDQRIGTRFISPPGCIGESYLRVTRLVPSGGFLRWSVSYSDDEPVALRLPTQADDTIVAVGAQRDVFCVGVPELRVRVDGKLTGRGWIDRQGYVLIEGAI